MVETDFYAILDALIAAPFGRFVGGMGFCILLRRSRANTRCDHSREPSNLARLLPVLEAHDAIYRIQRRLRPTVNQIWPQRDAGTW